MPALCIRPVRWHAEAEQVALLMREFHAFLRSAHDFDAPAILEELPHMAELYAEDRGTLLVAEVDGRIAGCFGLKPYDETTAEAKRMFVRPGHRGLGLGTRLLEGIVSSARGHGYRRILLDSLRSLPEAHRLYFTHGFERIPPYNALPEQVAYHMARDLTSGA